MKTHPRRSRRLLSVPEHLRKENPTPADFMFQRIDGRLVVLKDSLGALASSLRYPALTFLVFRKGPKEKLVACRGASRACRVRGSERLKLGPCTDCILLNNENTTLGALYERMQKGDA